MRIPFDSLTLAAVARECQSLVGARVQKVVETQPLEWVIGLYGGAEFHLLINCDPNFFRAHLSSIRPRSQGEPSALCAALRARLTGGRVRRIEQLGLDRVLRIGIETEEGVHELVAELMGRSANLVLLGPDRKIVSAARYFRPDRSSRPVVSGKDYHLPALSTLPPATTPGMLTSEGDGGLSPFLRKLTQASGMTGTDLREVVTSGKFAPVLVSGCGAYPISVAPLIPGEVRRDSISVALENHYLVETRLHEAHQLRSSLLAQLRRVMQAREVALADLGRAAERAEQAAELQLHAELVLAYSHTIEPGSRELITEDYAGAPVRIPLNPELSAVENAEAYFKDARKAKDGAAHVAGQIERLSADREVLGRMIQAIGEAADIASLVELKSQAMDRRYVLTGPPPGLKPEERPFGGHKIREILGPKNVRILYGETATANDYLTQRVARPNDYWLHVRAGTSAHVVVLTNNHPERVGREVLEFAARIAAQHSAAKHSRYVPVDYTLKKYVRKPRRSPAGTVLYTHEKTIDVEMSVKL